MPPKKGAKKFSTAPPEKPKLCKKLLVVFVWPIKKRVRLAPFEFRRQLADEELVAQAEGAGAEGAEQALRVAQGVALLFPCSCPGR